jgi:penicillin-insensitive murein endopeptidase
MRIPPRRLSLLAWSTLACAPPSPTPDRAAEPREAEVVLATPVAEPPRASAPPVPPAPPSTSVGSPIAGELRGGASLPVPGPGYRADPRKVAGRQFGTTELVAALVRAAAEVERELPGSELTIGDLSLEHGGEITGHGSHRNGRDADVMFYLLDAQGRPRPGHPIPLDPDGRGTDYRDLARAEDDIPVALDVPRTWRLLQALVSDPDAGVQRIFVAEHLRTLLLAHAERADAPAEAIERFAEVTCQPGFPHDDHVHVRVFCSAQDIAAGCLDMRPIYPWRRAELGRQGVEPVLAGARTEPAPRLVSTDEARRAAGPMHEDVVEFLDRRQAWVRQPHPGRKWCR